MVLPAIDELMRRVKSGDVTAFEQVVERYKGQVYGLCFSLVRSREDAEEAAQDAFLKLFRSRDSFELGRPLEPWLLRIAGNASRDVLRRRRTTTPPAAGAGEGELLLQLVEDPRSKRDDSHATTRQAVRQVVDGMSDRFRQPLVLRYLNGMTNGQIAAALGISLSNVKVRLARAKDVLQSRLAEVRD